MPKLKNLNFNGVVLVKYDIILNFIKISGCLGGGPRLGPKCLELGPKAPISCPNSKTVISIELYW